MILFRADGNAHIGSGHIMRCLSIADAFKRKNKDCLFVLADNTFQPLIESRGYAVYILESDYCDMDGEFENLKEVILSNCSEMLIADSYFVTANYLQKLKVLAYLVYIDDLASFAYPADVLVNYNAYGPDIDYKKLYFNENVVCPRLILGAGYVPLREMFRNVPKNKQRKTVKDILISTGGADSAHLALKIAECVAKDNTYDWHFLIGTMNPDYGEIKKIAEKNKTIHIHYNVKDMKYLICSCDLVVSAAGSTMYEIAACGVPMITYVLADNQIPGAEAFAKLGLAVSCGDLRDKENTATILMDAVDRMEKSFILRKQIGEKMQHMIDGFGADRLVGELLKTCKSRQL